MAHGRLGPLVPRRRTRLPASASPGLADATTKFGLKPYPPRDAVVPPIGVERLRSTPLLEEYRAHFAVCLLARCSSWVFSCSWPLALGTPAGLPWRPAPLLASGLLGGGAPIHDV